VGRAKYWGDIVAKLVIGAGDAQLIKRLPSRLWQDSGMDALINVAVFFNSGVSAQR